MKLHPEITPELAAWIGEQPLFFNATAPLAADGRINLSPRGLDSLRVLGPHQVAWFDLNGSGNESAAHLAENGRVTLMFCAFSGPAQILRLYGRGEVVLPNHPDFAALRARFPAELGEARQIVRMNVDRVQTSCGYGVPLMELQGQRDQLTAWAERKGPEGLKTYRRNNNRTSIDGLPAPHCDD